MLCRVFTALRMSVWVLPPLWWFRSRSRPLLGWGGPCRASLARWSRRPPPPLGRDLAFASGRGGYMAPSAHSPGRAVCARCGGGGSVGMLPRDVRSALRSGAYTAAVAVAPWARLLLDATRPTRRVASRELRSNAARHAPRDQCQILPRPRVELLSSACSGRGNFTNNNMSSTMFQRVTGSGTCNASGCRFMLRGMEAAPQVVSPPRF